MHPHMSLDVEGQDGARGGGQSRLSKSRANSCWHWLLRRWQVAFGVLLALTTVLVAAAVAWSMRARFRKLFARRPPLASQPSVAGGSISPCLARINERLAALSADDPTETETPRTRRRKLLLSSAECGGESAKLARLLVEKAQAETTALQTATALVQLMTVSSPSHVHGHKYAAVDGLAELQDEMRLQVAQMLLKKAGVGGAALAPNPVPRFEMKLRMTGREEIRAISHDPAASPYPHGQGQNAFSPSDERRPLRAHVAFTKGNRGQVTDVDAVPSPSHEFHSLLTELRLQRARWEQSSNRNILTDGPNPSDSWSADGPAVNRSGVDRRQKYAGRISQLLEQLFPSGCGQRVEGLFSNSKTSKISRTFRRKDKNGFYSCMDWFSAYGISKVKLDKQDRTAQAARKDKYLAPAEAGALLVELAAAGDLPNFVNLFTRRLMGDVDPESGELPRIRIADQKRAFLAALVNGHLDIAKVAWGHPRDPSDRRCVLNVPYLASFKQVAKLVKKSWDLEGVGSGSRNINDAAHTTPTADGEFSGPPGLNGFLGLHGLLNSDEWNDVGLAAAASSSDKVRTWTRKLNAEMVQISSKDPGVDSFGWSLATLTAMRLTGMSGLGVSEASAVANLRAAAAGSGVGGAFAGYHLGSGRQFLEDAPGVEVWGPGMHGTSVLDADSEHESRLRAQLHVANREVNVLATQVDAQAGLHANQEETLHAKFEHNRDKRTALAGIFDTEAPGQGDGAPIFS